MRTHEKPEVISASVVMEFRRATGMGVMNAKQFLVQSSPLLYSRFMEAIASNNRHKQGGLFYDPIEDEPDFAEVLKKAEHEATMELRQREKEFHASSPATVHFLWRRGQGRAFENIKQRILREKYAIEWFTLAEMNPGSHFSG